MHEKPAFLTVEQAAEHLQVSPRFVRRRIDLTRDGLPGGWPKSCWVNLAPDAGKGCIRVNLPALLAHLQGDEGRS